MVYKTTYLNRVTPDSNAKDILNDAIHTGRTRCIIGRIKAEALTAGAGVNTAHRSLYEADSTSVLTMPANTSVIGGGVWKQTSSVVTCTASITISVGTTTATSTEFLSSGAITSSAAASIIPFTAAWSNAVMLTSDTTLSYKWVYTANATIGGWIQVAVEYVDWNV